MKVTLEKSEVEKAVIKYITDTYLQCDTNIEVSDVVLTDNMGSVIDDCGLFYAEVVVVRKPKVNSPVQPAMPPHYPQ